MIDSQPFIMAKYNQIPKVVKQWYNTEKVMQLVKDNLSDDIERLESDDLAKKYRDYCCDKGGIVTHADSYKSRIINLQKLGQALCGIRFRGMDIEKPFVNVSITTNSLVAEEMAKVVTILKEQFSEFVPQYIQFYLPCDSHITTKDLKNMNIKVKRDRLLVANQLTKLIQPSINNTIKQNFAIKRVNNLDFYEDYVRAYQELFIHKPECKSQTRCETKEDLQVILDNNGFHFVLYDRGKFAGLFSLEWVSLNGLEGLYVVEKCIIYSLLGQGIGKQFEQWVMSCLFQQNLVSPHVIIFGEIDADNKPSLKSAHANGRLDIGQYIWLG